ncbi:hypothetical protein G8759_29710 [Spirosoma aureum]|uniref:BAAT/Acyl-CoA thioester hydrolase C-terminal domain-containing protein n=1 Tax=Spirosoma aureum TaxID=2692134 RepID=A0A6G9B0B2_9BACT|nr:acyl-CoA thioester hydrolase/BAAT C-terminal domain-containing protein [Spirosoma aureum]QIP18005.1 hypothetical protein G8759_29710 [Spirosoma aureum]
MQSTGSFKSATSADFVTDVECAIAYLTSRKEVNKTKIDLIGHNEGAILAALVAANCVDVAFMMMLAGAGLKASQAIVRQEEMMSKALGISEAQILHSTRDKAKAYSLIVQAKDQTVLKTQLSNYLKQYAGSITRMVPEGRSREQVVSAKLDEWTSPCFQYLIALTLVNVRYPFLALNGSKDLQVSAKENLATIATATQKGGNKQVTTKELSNLNHFF